MGAPTKISRESLLAVLEALADGDTSEEGHIAADALLLAYIDDPEIEAAYGDIGKWYA
jgi:hypothetical protein